MRAAVSASLVIPCFNEAENLPLLIERCSALKDRSGVETILVDNGSVDGSLDVLARLLDRDSSIRSVRVENNVGYGHGICAGLKVARGDVLAWTHADLQTDPQDVLRGLEIFDAHPTPERVFVKGLRQGRPILDRVFTIGMSVFETGLMGARLWDINAQPTLFHRALYDQLLTPPDDFSLDLYVYLMARKRKLEIVRFPVEFGDRLHGQSKWNVDFGSKLRFIRRTLGYSLELRRNFDKHGV